MLARTNWRRLSACSQSSHHSGCAHRNGAPSLWAVTPVPQRPPTRNTCCSSLACLLLGAEGRTLQPEDCVTQRPVLFCCWPWCGRLPLLPRPAAPLRIGCPRPLASFAQRIARCTAPPGCSLLNRFQQPYVVSAAYLPPQRPPQPPWVSSFQTDQFRPHEDRHARYASSGTRPQCTRRASSRNLRGTTLQLLIPPAPFIRP